MKLLATLRNHTMARGKPTKVTKERKKEPKKTPTTKKSASVPLKKTKQSKEESEEESDGEEIGVSAVSHKMNVE
jgi:hypothetical protein